MPLVKNLVLRNNQNEELEDEEYKISKNKDKVTKSRLIKLALTLVLHLSLSPRQRCQKLDRAFYDTTNFKTLFPCFRKYTVRFLSIGIIGIDSTGT